MYLSKVYASETIDELMACGKCNHRLDAAKMLPCGTVVCSRCATNMINQSIIDDSNEFKCEMCAEMHKLPEKDFPICEPIMSILKLKPKLITHDKERDSELEASIEEIDSLIGKFETYDKNLMSNIHECHSKLREQIVSTTKSKINQLERQSLNLIAQVDKHEKECVSQYERNQSSISSHVKESIQKFKSFYNELYFDTTLNDSQADIVQQALNEQKSLMTTELDALNLFTNNSIQFIPNNSDIDPNLLGTLKLTVLKGIDFNRLNKISLENDFVNQDGFEVDVQEFGFGFFLNDYMVICFTSASKLYLMIYDEMKQYKSRKVIKKIKKFEDDLVVGHTKTVLMYTDSRLNNQLEVYDSNLNLCCNASKSLKERLIGGSREFIFIYSEDEESSPICLYNWNLELVQTIGQRKWSNDAFYFSPKLSRMLFFQEAFFYLVGEPEKKIIHVMDAVTGKKRSEIETKSGIIIEIDRDTSLRVINENNEGELSLSYFTANGELLSDVELINFPVFGSLYTCSFLAFTKKGRLAFFDRNEYCLMYE